MLYGVCSRKLPTKECIGPVTLSYHCSQLHCGGISVYLKGHRKVWVGQYYLFGNGRLVIVKCLLIYRIPPPWLLFGTISFGGFSLSTLSHLVSERGQHFTTLCPHIPILINNSKKLS
jgi:hypothetical protein